MTHAWDTRMRHPNQRVSNGWIVAVKPKPEAAARLFCFSHAGAGSASYRGWGDDAPEGLEVCTIQLPGRENRLREAPFTSLSALARALADAIQPVNDRPFAFFGHSLGATIAFETARELRRSGNPLPATLFVSASRAPQLPWPHPPVRHLNDVDLLTEVHRRYGSVPEVLFDDVELRELLTPTLRADMTLIETYRYEPEAPFDCPVIAFGGDEDRMVARSALDQWNDQTSGHFRLRILAGDHLFLQSRRQELLEDIGGALGLSQGRLVMSSAG
jgi:medium-chain acyl-[acyl-carrier-protein] hydrolase